ncbi:hypothetical protein BGZ49_009088 [Haplosporangium sp. Z 27]|nr:hypothetical protein BGZ49_009088 [Haplosporangium sp. Z 27]
MDQQPDRPSRSTRRVGSNDSLAAPYTGQMADGSERQDEYSGIGRQGEWNQDARELSPANSITSIRSLLSSPKHKLSKLADKIQRSTSPSSSSHIQHEHRQGSKHLDDSNGQGRRQMPKSPPLGPAMPIAYVPAVERVRYTPFQPPPTTKAKEFLKAAAQYQQEMAIGGALSGFGDNVEFDLDDKRMASAIHNWISRKDSEGLYHNQSSARSTSPIQIPGASPNRRRPTVGTINTQVGSFTSQHSPIGASPTSYDSPTSPGARGDFPASPSATSFSNQTTSRFLHHPHRQPAAPQTEAFGSAPEDCITDPPLFAKPLPLPSPPRAVSPLRAGVMKSGAQPRSISPGPIQSPESLALAREAFERVKRAASPVRDNTANVTSSSNNDSTSGFIDPPHPSSLELNPSIKVPIPISASTNLGASPSSPSGLSRLLGNSAETTSHLKHARDGHAIGITPPQSCPSPELQHVPMNRPLPVPAPKPKHLNQTSGSTGINVANFTQRTGAKAGLESAPKPIVATSSGHLRNPQPPVLSTSPSRSQQATSSGHLNHTTRENHMKAGSVQHNTYVPKPTPIPTARPVLPVQHTAPKNKHVDNRALLGKKTKEQDGVQPSTQANGSGFVYPKAARKPVPGVKPAVAAKPRNLATAPRTGDNPENTTGNSRGLEQGLHRNPQNRVGNDMSPPNERSLGPTVSMKAPQTIPESQTQSEEGRKLVSDKTNQARHTSAGLKPRKGALADVQEEREVEAGAIACSVENMVPKQDLRGRRGQQHEQFDPNPRHLTHQDETDIQIPEQEFEDEPETHGEIRAQAIAAANSFRATGAHTGGYVVNTGRLRQVIKDKNSNSSGSGSGQLIQAIAGGAGALIAASAAASGLGWRQSSSISTEVSAEAPRQAQGRILSSPPDQSRASHQNSSESKDRVKAPRNGYGRPDDQMHDLTMKDINFQTLSPTDHYQRPDQTVIPVITMATDIAATTATTTTKHKEHPAYEGTKSSRLITSRKEALVAVQQQQQSKSLPGSRIIENAPEGEPLVAISTTTVEAIADPTTIAIPTPNLDKTLPKIQEANPRSRVFERPDQSYNDVQILAQSKTTSAQVSGLVTQAKPLPTPRNVRDFGKENSGAILGANAVVGGGNVAPKVINPKLQAYIQKYNLATNMRQ